MMNKHTFFKVKEQTVLRKVGDDYMIVPISGTLSSKGALFQLNETAADIWKFINEEKETTIEQINNYICKLYKVTVLDVQQDTESLIKLFLEKNLLEEV